MPDLTQEPWLPLLRILLAAGLGAALGVERDLHGRAAGLRTHILVSAGAAVFMILSTHIATIGPHALPDFARVTDPGRIAAQVVTGIGFLGAGTIIKDGFTVRGLTTAAALWVAASIGMASGAGFYAIALATTALAVFSLVVLSRLERSFRRVAYRELVLTVPSDVDVGDVVNIVEAKHVKVLSADLTFDYEQDISTARLALRLSKQGDVDRQAGPILQRIKEAGMELKKAKWRRS